MIYDELPKNVQKAIDPTFKLTSLQHFINRTEDFHDLFEWHNQKIYHKKKFKFLLAKNKMTYSTFDTLRKAIFKMPFKKVILNKPVKVAGNFYTKVHLQPPEQNKKFIYIHFMKIYLEE